MKNFFLSLIQNIDPDVKSIIRRKVVLGDQYGWLRFYPRFKEKKIKFRGKKLLFIDSHSFVFMHQEIFVYEIYKFQTSSASPYIIDGGANIGLASIYFAHLFPDSKILAFEPDPKIFSVLSTNIQSQKVNNVQAINKGLWDEETFLSFQSDNSDGGRINSLSKEKSTIKVPVCSLRPYLQQKVDMLKLDIEGAEYRVLQDISDLLPNVDRLFLEYHSFSDQPQVLPQILDILQSAGFRFYLSPAGIKNDQPFVGLKKMQGMDNQINIFCYRTSLT